LRGEGGMNVIRETWRTVCLMDDAGKLYRNGAGALFLLDLHRSSGKPPRRGWMIPSEDALGLLLEIRCLTASLVAIEVVLLVLGWVYLPRPLAIPTALLVIGAFGLTQHLEHLSTRVCVETPGEALAAMDFVKASEAASLRFVTPIRIGAVLVGLSAFLWGVQTLAADAAAPLNRLIGYLAVFVTLGCIRLVVLGGWVVNPDRRPAVYPSA
jgi:hypothetical protein